MTSSKGPSPSSSPVGQTVELLISDLGEDDTCFGRLDSGIGVFVKGFTAPGDRVTAKVKAAQKRFLHADLLEILEPGEPRLPPPCPHFALCGGCKWQQIPYSEELRLKENRLRSVFRHLARIPDPPLRPILHADEPFPSRNKLQFDFAQTHEGNPQPGFHRHGSFTEIVPIETCLHASPLLDRVFQSCRHFFSGIRESIYNPQTETGCLRRLSLRESIYEHRVSIDLSTASPASELLHAFTQFLLSDIPDVSIAISHTLRAPHRPVQTISVHGNPTLTENVSGFLFDIPPDGFFQVNTSMPAILVQQALDAAQLRSDDLVFDLYSGVGLFSLPLAKLAKRVAGFESHSLAVRCAKANAVHNDIQNTQFHCCDLSRPQEVRSLTRTAGFSPHVLLADPPRSGLRPSLLDWICKAQAHRFIYVSCNPASLARDVGHLVSRGGYRLETCIPVDLFPRTNHQETLCLLSR